MTTITKRGKVPADVEYDAICDHCKTEFKFYRHEAGRESHHQRDGNAMIIACPLCGKDVWRAF
jgi:uncharacterized protein with PIN domain